MNKLMTLFAVFLCLPTGLAINARPQHSKTELEVEGAMLSLGMTKSEVAEKLAGREFTKLDENNWVIGQPEQARPLIQFTNGRLTFTERYWATGENDTADALFGAVISLNESGFSVCNVTAGMKTSPNETAHNVAISCGDKSVVVVRVTRNNKTYTMVHENLGHMH
jgi:hypothetical protein